MSNNRRQIRGFRKSGKCVAFCFVSVIVCAIAGCGGAYDATVSGIVTLDGKALPGGLVGFHPVSAGPSAYAVIDDSGKYSVRTGTERGLPPGDYKVTASANEPPASERGEQGGPPPPGKSITPAWYRMKETSGLQYTVKLGSNTINLELKSQPPAGWKPGQKAS
jgi:hypothetical protein